MSSEPGPTGPRRLALVLARHSAASGAPPGIAAAPFAAACLADSYEVVADLVDVSSGIVGTEAQIEDLLWPGDLGLSEGAGGVRELAGRLGDTVDELVVVPADVPDLPGLVLAKVFKALQQADVCLAPERGGVGSVAVGVRLPWPGWLSDDLDLDTTRLSAVQALAPTRRQVATGPDWHRLRTPAAIQRLDPGLEGWEMTRSLLGGHALVAE